MPRLSRKTRSKGRPAAAARQSRADGLSTRAKILNAAGALYAMKGFAHTTSKEICASAGTDMAAVNYHFGSKDALYEEVLVEAHRQLIAIDAIEAVIGSSSDSAEDKLLAIVGGIARRAGAPEAPWGIRVLARELTSPSVHTRTLIERAIAPKAALMRGLLAQTLGLAPEDAVVQRSFAFVIGQLLLLMLAPKELRRLVLPAIDGDPEAFAADLRDYMKAGLRAVGARHRKQDRPR